MNLQKELTLITPVTQGHEDDLSDLLRKIKDDLEEGKKEKFENSGNIHFARWVFVNKKEVDENFENILDSRLIFSFIYDGDEEEQFDYLSDSDGLGDFVDSIYDHCIEYPSSDARTAHVRKAYLKKWRVEAAASYIGAPHRSVQRIRDENNLRNFIRGFLDSGNWTNKTAGELHKIIQQKVFLNTEFEWAKKSAPLPKVNWPGMVLVLLCVILLCPLIITWILILHFFYEKNDVPMTGTRSQVSEKHMQSLEECEDWENQNQFTQLLIMKPGKVRLITIKALMLMARILIRLQFVKGKLMGIPTIHFARWLLIDNNKHMIFFSNFDGSWQQYLGDFIDKSGIGLTGIFSNTFKFPKTRFLIFGGAYLEEHFLAWSRHYELPTQIWYSAYPHLSIKNIVNNSLIRKELLENLGERGAEQFLKRF